MALSALVFTWPLAARLPAAIPAGGGPPTVALFGLFTVEWTAQALDHGRPYWDPPIFHPHRGTFAWSEPQPLTSLVVWALSRLVGIVAAYNLTLLALMAAAGVAGYAFARQLTDDRVAALWAGVWLTAGAYPIEQIGVLHLIATAFPIACLALAASLARGFRARAVWGAGLAFLLTMLTCAQYGLFLAMLLPILLLPAIAWRSWRWPQIAALGASLGAGASLALPFLLAQRARLDEMGLTRSLVNVRGAYLPLDLITPARGHWLASGLFDWPDTPDVYPRDVGLVPLMFLLVWMLSTSPRLRGADPLRRRVATALSAMTLAALALGFGPRLGVTVAGESVGPYVWLRAVVPGLDGVRTPSRFALFVSVGVAVLGAAALASLRARTEEPRRRRALGLAAFALLVMEMWALPVALVEPRAGVDDHGAVIAWLRRHGMGEPLVELPLAADDSEADLAREVAAMRRALGHQSPVVNGYSGYLAETYRQVRTAMRTDPAGKGLRYLRALGVRLVLLHGHDLAAGARPPLERALGASVVLDAGDDALLRLDGEEPAPPVRVPAAAPGFPEAPRAGDILRIPIEPGRPAARLATASRGDRLRVTWRDAAGWRREKEVRLHGSVLVDAGSGWLHLEVQRFPRGSGPADAVLISEERMARREAGSPLADPSRPDGRPPGA